MKNNIINLIIIICLSSHLFSCGNKNKTSNADIKDTTNIDTTFIKINKEDFDTIYNNYVFIKNTSDYSERFIKEFLEIHIDYCKENNICIFLLNDTIQFVRNGKYDNYPDIFPVYFLLNQQVVFDTIRNDTTYNLSLERINISTYRYDLHITSNDEQILKKQGYVDVNTAFYLAASGDFENEDDEVIGFYTDYVDKDKDYYLTIGIGEIDNDEIKTQFSYVYKNEHKRIGSPMLNMKK